MSKKQNTRVRMAALLLSTGLVAAACGSDTITAADVVAEDDAPAADVVAEDDAPRSRRRRR